MISRSPPTQHTRAPTFAATFGASLDEGIRPAAIGSTLTAAISALSPRTSCRYCISTKIRPKKAKNCNMIDREPAANAGRVNSRGSSNGADVRSSHSTNPTSSTSPTPRPPRVVSRIQPCSGASMIE